MTLEELKAYILTQLTPDQVIDRFLEKEMIIYDKLKFNNGEAIHPTILIAHASMDMGWNFMIEENHENIRGMVVGTEEYMNDLLKINIKTLSKEE